MVFLVPLPLEPEGLNLAAALVVMSPADLPLPTASVWSSLSARGGGGGSKHHASCRRWQHLSAPGAQ